MPTYSSATRPALPTYLEGEYAVVKPGGSLTRQGYSATRGPAPGSVIVREGGSVSRAAPALVSQSAGPAPILIQEDGAILVTGDSGSVRSRDRYEVVDDSSVRRGGPGSVERADRYVSPEHYDGGSPGSRLSRVSRASKAPIIDRIVSLPFPNARPAAEPEYPRPDERDDIIRELRSAVSRLEHRIHVLRTEGDNLQKAGTRANDEVTELKHEIARLTKLLDEERAISQVNLSSEEGKRREAFELVDLQRKLLLLKDEEIRQLSQLAAAHKEQIFILYSHLGAVEVNNILDDAFDVRQIDVATLDPESRQRVVELIRAPNMNAHFDVAVRQTPTPSDAVYATDPSAAYALDAADGVIDGRFQGQEIMVPKPKSKPKSSGYGRPTAADAKAAELRKQLAEARKERQRLSH
eukprot:EG_transcript_9874